MVRCVLSQLKPEELYILSCGKRPRPSAKNVEVLGRYPIRICDVNTRKRKYTAGQQEHSPVHVCAVGQGSI